MAVFLALGAVQARLQIYDANSHPKFVRELPTPAKILTRKGQTLSIPIVEHAHDWGLVNNDNSLVGAAKMWSFANQYPGPTIVVERGVGLEVHWSTDIAGEHILDSCFDRTLECLNNTVHCVTLTGNAARFSVHLHGSASRPESDGMLASWFTKDFKEVGPDWRLTTLSYPNDINSTLLWYHDHASGIARLNHYAGLSGLYIVRDSWERELVHLGVLPDEDHELQLVIEDREFNPDGSIAYQCDLFNDGKPSVLPEFFGDYIAVNGVVWPKATVAARRYRLRILNNADSRFFTLSFSGPDGNKVRFLLVGGDHGFLSKTEALSELVIGPAERADVVVNFGPFGGHALTLVNDAAAPFPDGDPPTPATALVMQFQVRGFATRASDVKWDPASTIAATIKPLGATIVRKLGLFEGEDSFGRVFPRLGTLKDGALSYAAPVTEIVRAGVPEEWEIYDFTQDAHPIHLHFTRFRVISRRAFELGPDGAPVVTKVLDAIPGDNGLKDTVQIYPNTVVNIQVLFEIPGDYMWHCHIFAHEDNEMIRPIRVLPWSPRVVEDTA